MDNLNIKHYLVKPNQNVTLADYTTCDKVETVNHVSIQEKLRINIEQLKVLQQKLLAEKTRSIIIVLQALNVADKDEAKRYLISSLSPLALRTRSVAKPC